MSGVRRRALLLAVAVALSGAACGGSDGDAVAEGEAPTKGTETDLGPNFTPATTTATDGQDGDGDGRGDGDEAATTTEVELGPIFGPRVISFASQSVGGESAPETVVVRNEQEEPFSVTGVTVTGDHPADFVVETTCIPDEELQPDEACDVVVRFRPTEPGDRRAVLSIGADGERGQIRLAGQATG